MFLPTAITTRALSPDTTINLIIGILTLAVGLLSAILAWAMWRVSSDGRRRLRRSRSEPSPIELLPTGAVTPRTGNDRLGYEVAFRVGRSM